jgi:hypothetical protein
VERLLEHMRPGVAAAGARLVSWDGLRIDVDGGGAAFTGHGHPVGHGTPVAGRSAVAKPVLFASGAAVLVRREDFWAVGGFDETYFAYYEDVDLGWRLTLSGRDVVHVPTAVVRHRGGGSASQIAPSHRSRLHERNALVTVAKAYDDLHLRSALPAALGLAAWRAGAPLGAIESARSGRDRWPPLPVSEWPGWPSLAPLEIDWHGVWRARAQVQAGRRRSDSAIVERMGQALAPVPATPAGWAALGLAFRVHELGSLFGPEPTLARAGALGAVARLFGGRARTSGRGAAARDEVAVGGD